MLEPFSSPDSRGLQVLKQQYPSFAKPDFPSQNSFEEQSFPFLSTHVSEVTLKSSVVLPFGRVKRSKAREKTCSLPYWSYVIFRNPLRWPEFFGFSVIVKLWTVLAGRFSRVDVSRNVMSEFIFKFVMFSSPKLNNSIVFVLSCFSISSAVRLEGSDFRESSSGGVV